MSMIKEEYQKSPTEVDYCERDFLCLQNFFEDFTKEYGLAKSLQKYDELSAKNPEVMSDCHYIFHGMGHGQLTNNNGDVGESFSNFDISKYEKHSFALCVSGYFHGVIEKVTEGVNDERTLVNMLRMACKEIGEKNLDELNCYHGVGHVSLIHYEQNIEKALGLCDSLVEKKVMVNSCHSGVFMEMAKNYIKPEDNPEDIDVGMKSLKACDSLPLKYQAECYNQQSYLFTEFTTDQGFIDNLLECQKVKDQTERIYCIRMYVKPK